MDVTEAAAALDRARQGDSEAFRALVEPHSRTVFRLAFRMTGNEQDAEDVVQDSFLRAYRQLGRFEARANFGTWLYRIAANSALNLLREKHSRGHGKMDALGSEHMDRLSSDGPGPERLAEGEEAQRRIA